MTTVPDLNSPLERELMGTTLAEVMGMVAMMIEAGISNGFISEDRLDFVDEQCDRISERVLNDAEAAAGSDDVGGQLEIYAILGLVTVNLFRNFTRSTMMAADLANMAIEFGSLDDLECG